MTDLAHVVRGVRSSLLQDPLHLGLPIRAEYTEDVLRISLFYPQRRECGFSCQGPAISHVFGQLKIGDWLQGWDEDE